MIGRFFTRKKNFPGLLSTTDLHSHLLPGIDDGVQDLEESLEVINGFVNLGFKKLITTPHIMHDFYKNDAAIITARLQEVREALAAGNINITLEAAAEYYLDEFFLELIGSDTPLLTFGDNYVLFELSFTNKPLNIKEVIFNLQTKGYRPVLAHAERYLYFHRQDDLLQELYDSGVFLQLNLLSLSGYYSAEVKKMAARLLNRQMISFIGSDCHNAHQLMAVGKTLNSAAMNPVAKQNLLNQEL